MNPAQIREELSRLTAGLDDDFDGVPDLPQDVPDCAAFPAILDRMRERGFSEVSIAKIAGGNFRRVLEANP